MGADAIRKLKENDHARHALDEPRTGPRSNLDRALHGRDVAALALNDASYMAFEDYEDGLVDALTNLMHFARRYEMDFDEALDTARLHHAAEARRPWDEVG